MPSRANKRANKRARKNLDADGGNQQDGHNDDVVAASEPKRRCSDGEQSDKEQGAQRNTDDTGTAAAPDLTADERTLLALRSALTRDPSVPYTKDAAAVVMHLPGSLTRLPACKVDSTLAIVKMCCIAPNLMYGQEKRHVQMRERMKALGVWDGLFETCVALITRVKVGCLGDFTKEFAPFEAYMPDEGEGYKRKKNALTRELILTRKVAFLCYQFYLGGPLARSPSIAEDISRAHSLCLVSETNLWTYMIVALAECTWDLAVFSRLHNILGTIMTGHPKCTPRLASCMNAVAEVTGHVHPSMMKKLVGSLLMELHVALSYTRPACYNEATDKSTVVLYPSHPGTDLYYVPQCLYYVYNLRNRCLGPMPCNVESPKECVVNNFKSMAAYMTKTEASHCIPTNRWCWGYVPDCHISEKLILPKYVKRYGAPREDDDVKRYHEVANLQYELPEEYGLKVWAVHKVGITRMPDYDNYEKMSNEIVQAFEDRVERNPSSDPRPRWSLAPMNKVKTEEELYLEAQVIKSGTDNKTNQTKNQ